MGSSSLPARPPACACSLDRQPSSLAKRAAALPQPCSLEAKEGCAAPQQRRDLDAVGPSHQIAGASVAAKLPSLCCISEPSDPRFGAKLVPNWCQRPTGRIWFGGPGPCHGCHFRPKPPPLHAQIRPNPLKSLQSTPAAHVPCPCACPVRALALADAALFCSMLLRDAECEPDGIWSERHAVVICSNPTNSCQRPCEGPCPSNAVDKLPPGKASRRGLPTHHYATAHHASTYRGSNNICSPHAHHAHRTT